MGSYLIYLGNKTRLSEGLVKFLPSSFSRYFEPFLGSGSFYFYLVENRIIQNQKCFLSDIDVGLIATHICLRDPVRRIETLKLFRQYQAQHSREFFREVRNCDRVTLVETAAHYLYINRTCFSGIHRTNKNGDYNITSRPDGKVNWLPEEIYEYYGNMLQKARVGVKHYECLENKCLPGDFVYLDPPYYSLYATGQRQAYSSPNWNHNDHLHLRNFCEHLHRNGVKFMVSNSNSDMVWDLYDRFNINVIDVTYKVGTQKVEKTTELVITNYHV